jgi:DNA-binding NarL/FixJ family response regulator
MPQDLDIPATVVLIIHQSMLQRIYWAKQLKRSSSDYEILLASDSQSGLALYRSRRIDCVVLDLELPEKLGLNILVELVPRASRPEIAVIVLTRRTEPSVRTLVKQNGAYECFVSSRIIGEDLDRAIQRAIAFVGQMSKEDRYRPI